MIKISLPENSFLDVLVIKQFYIKRSHFNFPSFCFYTKSFIYFPVRGAHMLAIFVQVAGWAGG